MRTARESLLGGRTSVTVSALCAALLLALTAAAEEQPLVRSIRKGPVEAAVRVEPAELVIGDVITLTLTVTAQNNVELIMPEFGQVLERFAILDFVPTERTDDQGQTVVTQTYRLQPPRSGRQSIPPIMVEFVDRRPGSKAAPKGLDAYELLTERIVFTVASAVPEDVEAELAPPLGKLSGRGVKPTRWWWLLPATVLALAAPWAWRFWQSSRRRAWRRTAYEIAIGRLSMLLERPRTNREEVDSFFVELSSIVRWYLERCFDLRAPESTTEEFLAMVSQSPELSGGLVGDYGALLRDFLRRADLVKFANFTPSEQDVEESVSAAQRFLDGTRQDAPMIEQAMPPRRGGVDGGHVAHV